MEKKTSPQVRFKGYSDDWEERGLSEILIERKILQKISKDAPILAFAAGQGVIDRSERKSNNRDHLTHDQQNKIYKLTEYNDIVYNPSNLKYGAIDRNKYGRGVISPIYVTFTTEEEPRFVELIVKSEKFKLKALQFEEGTVVKRQSVKPENLLSLKVNISPSKDEQDKIGTFFEYLDHLIKLHERRYRKLTQIKNAMLHKMFPTDNSGIPEIRFNGYDKHWTNIPFEKIYDFSISTNSLSRSGLSDRKGEIKNIHYGDILVRYGATLDIKQTKVPQIIDGKIDDYKNHILKDGDIIIADAAEDYAVGKATEITNIGNDLVVSGLHTIVCRPKIKFQPYYLGYYMNSNSYRKSLIPLFQGTKVLSISKTNLAKTYVKFPDSKEEQAKIGTFFKNLDTLIAFHQNEQLKLENIKIASFEKVVTPITKR